LASAPAGQNGWTVPVSAPALDVLDAGDRVRLRLAGLGDAEGATLQDAADALVRRLLIMAMAIRSGDVCFSSDCPLDASLVAFVWELGDIAAAGGDIRARLFG
jgi:hypothetical protein